MTCWPWLVVSGVRRRHRTQESSALAPHAATLPAHASNWASPVPLSIPCLSNSESNAKDPTPRRSGSSSACLTDETSRDVVVVNNWTRFGSLCSLILPDRSRTSVRSLPSGAPRDLRGTTIVFFTAGYASKRFVFERAHELGVRSVVLDQPDSWSRALVDEGLIARFISIDTTRTSDEVYSEALQAIKRLDAELDTDGVNLVDGITTFAELSVSIVARLAKALQLPGHQLDSVNAARDKSQTRTALRRANLPSPCFARIMSEADLDTAARHVGFPAVLKPVLGAASLAVKKVISRTDLTHVYSDMRAELGELVVIDGALVKRNDTCNTSVPADTLIGTCFLLEQYLDGNEVDVDIVMSEGEWRYAAVSDNGPTDEPYFTESWAVMPSLLPRSQQVELRDLAVDCVKALGFTDGVFHVECKYTSHGPHLVEVNARMGGGAVYETNLRTWSVDLVEETLLAAVGIPSRPDVPKRPLQSIAYSDVCASVSGTLSDMSFLEVLQDREDIVSYSPHVMPGSQIVCAADGMPTWLVEIVVSKPTPREALDLMIHLEAEVNAKVVLTAVDC
eukprot:TRINITY_DN22483_c0_g1_i1.p1 TRINITY_DN22483_c0_g1~~TRINITY_DN22483_c0_g1_i1.p1  ORF type:complete len:564 (-),score=73.95 TRINITY_DN22483_c0_g1_i1:207-1898(-)